MTKLRLRTAHSDIAGMAVVQPADFAGLIAANDDSDGLVERARYWLARLNWPAIGAALALEGAFLAVLMMLGVVPITPPRAMPTVVALIPFEQPAASSPPAQPEQKETPEPPKPVQAQVQAPPPEVKMPLPVEQPVMVAVPAAPAPAPSRATAAASAAIPAAPASGPVNVANLGTNLLNGTAPRYPIEARHKRQQGTVILRVVISEQGRVVDISISQSSGFDSLDKAALDAVRKWRWNPMVRDGKPVPVTGLVQIPFVLKNA